MSRHGAAAVAGVLLLAMALLYVVRDVRIESDYSVFLPAGEGDVQRAFMRELRDGVASRIVLIELAGAAPEALAETSRRLAAALAASPSFGYVANGSAALGQREVALLTRHRYVLSDRLDDAAHFAPDHLRTALEDRIEGLSGSAGMLEKSLLSSDPTGELRRVLTRLAPRGSPRRERGVWFDATGERALLLAETRASGSDLAQQDVGREALRTAFAATRATPAETMEFSSPGVMALESRARIAADARMLSLVSLILVVAILAWVYRAISVVLLCMLPAALGLLAGVIAVNAWFGSVHGITLAFGATLLGEAVDYPSYLLTQVRADTSMASVKTRFGRTLWLAVLTTACGAVAFIWSGFPGLAQLGTLTIVGVLVAGAITWWCVPRWLPAQWSAALPATRETASVAHVRWSAIPLRTRVVVALIIVGTAAGFAWNKSWWDDDLASMNPLPAEFKARDIRLRGALGAPDVRYAVITSASSREAVLQASEALRGQLVALADAKAFSSFDLVSDYIPSQGTQDRRRTALPDPETLRNDLEAASRGLPFRADSFAPFVAAVALARTAPPLTVDDYRESAFRLRIESMLRDEGGQWQVVVPLAGVADAAAIARSLPPGARLLDLRGEAIGMMAAYRHQAVVSACVGLALICLVLVVGLRSLRAAITVLGPVLLAVGTTGALLIALGQPLTVFHFVALLLTAGVGVNYALVMARGAAEHGKSGTWRTLAVVSATALVTFGLLALSSAPVLRALGETVCIGVLLSLVFGALLIDRECAAGAVT